MITFGRKLSLALTTICLISAIIYFPCIDSQSMQLFHTDTLHSKILSNSNWGRSIYQDSLKLKTLFTSSNVNNAPNFVQAFETHSIFSRLRKDKDVTSDLLDLLFVNVSTSCANHFGGAIEKFLNFRTVFPETWVLQMFDSYGKIPSGILSGHTAEPGDFQECVGVNNGEVSKERLIRGKYCTTFLYPGPKLENLLNPVNNSEGKMEKLEIDPGLREATDLLTLIEYMLSSTPPTMLPIMGTCLPSSCSDEDAQQFFNNLHTNIFDDWTGQDVQACTVEEKPPLDAADYCMLVLLASIAALCIVGTAVDVQGLYSPEGKLSKPGKFTKIILAFSFYTNTKKFLSTRSGSDNLKCLHGVRFLSLTWVLLCHTFEMIMTQLNWNLVDMKQLISEVSLAPVLNGTLAVDTFFTLSGALVAYNLLKELDKRKGKFNYFMFAIHRYLRLTPAYAVVIGLMATLVPYFGNGPYWFAVEQDQAKCIRHWWQNLLYINNFVKNESDLCYPESWYLANDMQFFLLSPLLIYPLWRFKLIGVGTTCLAAIASIVVSAVVTHQMEWAPTVIYSIPFKNYFVGYYMKPWNRFGTYVVGIVLGYILYLRLKNPTKFKAIPKVVVIVGWILSTFLALGVIFGGMYYFDPKNEEETFTSVHAAIYAGIHRQVFSVSIAWVVFACVTGNGGWVNSLLSWKVFMPLGRLTFCMYITAYRLQLIYHLMQPHPVHLSVYNTVYMFFAHLVMSSLVAFLLTTSVETPFMQLEKLLFASQMQPKVPKPNMVEAAAVDPEDPKIVD